MRSFNGRTFSFSFLEPNGWMIDNEAAQLAHFVLHEEGVSWRDAPAILFVRLVDPRRTPHGEGEAEGGSHGEDKVQYESLQAFVDSNVESFKNACPFFEIEDVQLSRPNLAHEFVIKSYDCAGMRHEITAVTQVPGYFVLLVLSARTPEDIHKALPKYEEVVSSFYWRERKPVPRVPDKG